MVKGPPNFWKLAVKDAKTIEGAKTAAKAIAGIASRKTALFGADPTGVVLWLRWDIQEQKWMKTPSLLQTQEKEVEIVKNGEVKAYRGI